MCVHIPFCEIPVGGQYEADKPSELCDVCKWTVWCVHIPFYEIAVGGQYEADKPSELCDVCKWTVWRVHIPFYEIPVGGQYEADKPSELCDEMCPRSVNDDKNIMNIWNNDTCSYKT